MIRHQRGPWIHEGRWALDDARVIADVIDRNSYRLELVPRAATFIDLGAHIGCVSQLYHARHPEARIVAVEAAPENIPILRANCPFADVIAVACTYAPSPFLVSSFGERGLSTCGSYVVSGDLADIGTPPDFRQPVPVAAVTLEDIAARLGLAALEGVPMSAVIKVDCEGSEYSILASPFAQSAAYIFGEYHGASRWDAFRAQHFAGWESVYTMRGRASDAGIFHLRNPRLS